jgi:hypothetical protein
MSTTKAEFRALTISAGQGKRVQDQEDGWHRRQYRVRVTSDATGRHITFTYTDSAHNESAGKVGLGPSDLLEAFECFVSDAAVGAESFHHFCSDFGYDEDSRQAHSTWLACRRSGERLARLYHQPTDPADILDALHSEGVNA